MPSAPYPCQFFQTCCFDMVILNTLNILKISKPLLHVALIISRATCFQVEGAYRHYPSSFTVQPFSWRRCCFWLEVGTCSLSRLMAQFFQHVYHAGGLADQYFRSFSPAHIKSPYSGTLLLRIMSSISGCCLVILLTLFNDNRSGIISFVIVTLIMASEFSYRFSSTSVFILSCKYPF